jgi:pimeloyl-ACP methyl ester carboxylesterase
MANSLAAWVQTIHESPTELEGELSMNAVQDDAVTEARRARRWKLARIALCAGVILALLLAGAATYERIGERADAAAYPPAGVLIPVNHHRLHLYCVGPRGVGPTIVLENGLGGWSQTWGNIVTEVSKTARTCAYDRAGYGWSELGDLPHDALSIADQLHALLHGAGEATPFVLVGASIGGLYIRMYAHRFPDDVAGLVFLDPSHEDQAAVLPREQQATDRDKPERWKEWLARFGYFRWKYRHAADGGTQWDRAIYAHMSAPYYYTGKRRDIDDWTATDDEIRRTGSLGRIPLIVISAGSGNSQAFTAARQRLHARLAALSSEGSQEIAPDAAHASLIFNPKHSKYSISAILRVWRAASARGVNATGGDK